MAIKINEIFFSIQGESSYTGWPTVFVRTSGCHLRCNYCDTKYAYHEGGMQELDAIIEKIRAFPTSYVCITGGEPLLQKEVLPLMQKLCDMDYKVSLETSGDISCAKVDSRVLKVVDIKTPDSGEGGRFHSENLSLPPVNTEFKFVICSEKDFDWAEKFSRENHLFEKNLVLYSPSYGVVDENWLAKKILSEGSSARLQLQLHKYIWSPTQRGV
jgi:7-carboxy-7-deazaguanine synthase